MSTQHTRIHPMFFILSDLMILIRKVKRNVVYSIPNIQGKIAFLLTTGEITLILLNRKTASNSVLTFISTNQSKRYE